MNSIPFSPDWAIPAPTNSVQSAPILPERLTQTGHGLLPVIIAEDDPVSREVLLIALEEFGYSVTSTNDGREAMEALRAEKRPALAVIDWMMPGMDGIEICRRVRNANMLVYIILLTARGGKDRIVEGLQAGADDYLTKPFDRDELRARLQVGTRILQLHTSLTAQITELEAAKDEIKRLSSFLL